MCDIKSVWFEDGIQHIPAASEGNMFVLCGLPSVAGGSRRLGVVNRAVKTKTVREEPVLGRCKLVQWVFPRASLGKIS